MKKIYPVTKEVKEDIRKVFNSQKKQSFDDMFDKAINHIDKLLLSLN